MRGLPGERAKRGAGAVLALRAVRRVCSSVRDVPDLPRRRGREEGGGAVVRARCVYITLHTQTVRMQPEIGGPTPS